MAQISSPVNRTSYAIVLTGREENRTQPDRLLIVIETSDPLSTAKNTR
jgi:hypothetical protein